VVILAACESSVGAVRRGEGVLSLARGFFEAGAKAVVGTLVAGLAAGGLTLRGRRFRSRG
jgi:hypothetical protein